MCMKPIRLLILLLGIVFISFEANAVCAFNVLGGTARATSTREGLVLNRYLQGVRDNSMLVSTGSSATPTTVRDYINANACSLDLDGNGVVEQSDTLMISRHLKGMRNDGLTKGVSLKGVRTSAQSVQQYLDSGCSASPNAPQTCRVAGDAIANLPVDRMVKISANFSVDRAADKLAEVDRAKAAGANGVIFNDSKTNSWALGQTLGARWFPEMRTFYDGVRARNMTFAFHTVTIGYCGSVLGSDPNLTTGYPIRDQALRATGGTLIPVPTSSITNGDFETYAGNTAANWDFQDAAGVRTFIDTAVKRSGNASFRADATGGQLSRVLTRFTVKPWHQYRLRLWMKTNNLSAANILPIVQNDANKLQLTQHFLGKPKAGDPDDREYYNSPVNLTLDWTEVLISFNSQDATTVRLGLSVFGGTSGSVWWDDVSIEDAPTLNWINRSDLPSSARLATGTNILIGTDMSQPTDPKLGVIGFPGRYGSYHPFVNPTILNSTKIREGDTVFLSGYHALSTRSSQTGCSWNTPGVVTAMRTIHDRLNQEFQPDGYLLNYDEVRTGGFEPSDVAYGTSGAAFAASIQKAFNDMSQVAPNVRQLFFADMVDPFHNAQPGYYQVANTLEGSWESLDPAKVTIITWWEGQKITDFGASSLKFFADRGFKQIVGAYYDADVTDNYNRWQAAMSGIKNITGSWYYTSFDAYEDIEAFGNLWWP
jgi:hypothetical protein